MQCIFCKIIKGELLCDKVYEDDHVLAFLDIAPVNLGHILLVVKKHVESIEEVDDLLLGYVMQIVKKLGMAMKKSLKGSGYNIIINNGATAGQVVDHFHCHIIPRYGDDGLKAWPQKQYKGEEAKKMVNAFKSAL